MFFWAYPIALYISYLTCRIGQAFSCKFIAKRTLANRSICLHLFRLHGLLVCSLAGNVILTTIANVRKDDTKWWRAQDYLSSTLAVGLFYGAGLLPDPDVPYTPSTVQSYIWVISLCFETAWNVIGITLSVSRPVILLTLLVTFYASSRKVEVVTGEDEALLNEAIAYNNGYGTSQNKLKRPVGFKQDDAQMVTWLDYLRGFHRLFPFLWPADSRSHQIRAIFCLFLLVLMRVINIFVPHQMGVLVKSLDRSEGKLRIPHKELILYVIARGLQGQQGVVGAFRAILWIPISQSTYRRLTSAAFHHVLILSLDFHLSKRIGEVISALSKGSALNTFLDGFVFQLFPMVADLWIAAIYFFVEFNALYALMVISVTWIYLFVTIYMAKYRGRARREMAMREREMEAAKTDALISYETVHQSGAVPMEISRFEKLIAVFQGAEYSVFFSLNILNAVQHGVFTIGVLIVCYLNAYEITVGLENVSKFVTLLTYLAQLQAPLSFFGSFYTQVQNNLVDAERMLDLFKEEPTVVDHPKSRNIHTCEGHISFSHVTFSYNTSHTSALDDVSFDVLPGTSTAIVGESGSGKSTILKLLFRFYDVDSGSIRLDGLDMRDIKIDDLRQQIGVVPQDTVLFNDTLMYNLMYSKPDATEEQVYAACRAASIHEKILNFPNGYATNVGERGLKLSGGEKQRIAIARTFLRSPQILLLDEATAALDSRTERQIQASLEDVSQGRTTITIAHRLSTITKADQILVMHQGKIVERGRHEDLLRNRGVYAQMWNKQTKSEKEHAKY